MPVKEPLRAHRLGERVDRMKALPVAGRRLVRDEDVRLLAHQVLIDRGEDRRAVPPRQSAAPHVPRSDAPDEVRRAEVVRLLVGHPHLSAKDPAQARDAQTRDGRDASVQVVPGQGASPQVIVDAVRVRIVIPGNPPDGRKGERLLKDLLKGGGRLHVAEDHDGVGPVLARGDVDLIEHAVGVPAEEDMRETSRRARPVMPARPASSFSDLFSRHQSYEPASVRPE